MMFRFHETYDRERASDDVSRYGVYLRRYPTLFSDVDGPVTCDPVQFVAGAWRVATSPILSPPYLDWTAERLLSLTLTSSEHDGSLIARVLVAVPRPAALARVVGFADWARDADCSGVRGYRTPDDQEVAWRPALLASAALLFHIPADQLHAPVDAPGAVSAADAKRAVRRLAELLDSRLAPVLDVLEIDSSRSGG